MSLQGSPTLTLDVRTRRTERLWAFSTIWLTAATPALVISSMGIPAAILASAAIAVSLWMGFRRVGWIGRGQLARIVWQADGRWVLTFLNGRQFEAVLRPDSRMSTRLIWLRWEIPRDIRNGWTASLRHWMNPDWMNPICLLLAAGDTSASDFRRLRVRLRTDRGVRVAPVTRANILAPV